MADTLLREGNPPFGQLACPVPQYWRQDTQSFERVQGEHGASRVILYGPNGQPISSTNPIPVQLNGSNVPAKLAPAGRANQGFSRTGPIAASTVETLIEYVGQCDLESFVISQDVPFQVKVSIETRRTDGSYTNYMIPRIDGVAWDLVQISPSLLNDHNGRNDFFELFKYDTTNNRYSYGMKRQMKANGGIRICVWNTDTANPHNAAVFGDISTYES